jgi:CHAT domain-containing protein
VARTAQCADRVAGRLVLVLAAPFRRGASSGNPFVGFGDPDFGGGKTESVQAQATIQPVSLFRGGAANIDGLHQLPPLPETAGELQAEAQVLGAPVTSVYLRQDATVTKVKSLDLADTRVVTFATHGLVAGDLPALAEPALALTPPSVPTKEDDGLLRASDVSQLKLNADWVLLSACTTAAADGTPGAEGLSGLAKAFFYAGARSLLVSHWPVDSAATVKLTTSAFRILEKAPAIGRAEAFRRAMLAMVDGADKSDNPTYQAHPLYWAPFVVVGEGGSGK